MIWIILILAAFLLACFPMLRCAVFHPIKLCFYGLRDLRQYIKHKEWNCARYGQILCYIADDAISFGCGKTLSATDYIVSIYNQYNGKPVFDSKRRKWVTQRIKILSNVDFLTVPYERLVSLAQFVQFTDTVNIYDDQQDILTVTYLVIDEASSQLNSRGFKSNFDPYFISRLLTSRHVRASIILTAQRFGMVDKLMRDCTNVCIGCHKIWRFQLNNYYDAYELENAQSPGLVKPIRRTCWFVSDKAFANYDTYASVCALRKSCQEGDMLSEEEIMQLQVGDGNLDAVQHPSRRFIRSSKKRRK